MCAVVYVDCISDGVLHVQRFIKINFNDSFCIFFSEADFFTESVVLGFDTLVAILDSLSLELRRKTITNLTKILKYKHLINPTLSEFMFCVLVMLPWR